MESTILASLKVRTATHANLKELSKDTMVPLASLLDALVVGWRSLNREQRMAAIETAAKERKEQAQ